MKILTVFGTRPEAIKMAPLVKELEKDDFFNSKICVTGQHREMLDQVLQLFSIKPDYDLEVMTPGQSLNQVVSKIILGLDIVLNEFKPDLVLVHGDTSTCLAASLASFHLQIPIGHIEAGLRTWKISAPFPEEMNRTLVSKLAKYHFAPTELNRQNLIKENINPNQIFVTGNTIIDALQIISSKLSDIPPLLDVEALKDIFNNKKRFILVTTHRRENFGQGFINISEALVELAIKFKDIQIIFPVHLNPSVKDVVEPLLKDIRNIHLINPVDYFSFIYLINKCHLILTDSGGIQEEAPSLSKPVLLMRNETERPEAVEAGAVILVGSDKDKIAYYVDKLLTDDSFYENMKSSKNPYGDGKTAEKIISLIKMHSTKSKG